MTRLKWNDPGTRFFETGLDRGVLYPKGSPAVPWNGLVSVDETGAETSKIYYQDGRPYLIVPVPKEYEATLKAYTYPDEFSQLMGVVEATDGMYVDSQQGDSFDLSYRTLIGNDIDGVDSGYKIHLVYNAVVTPQGQSYSGIGSSIDATEFSWQIQAWPVPLAGYRSSAHIIIDTRHMDLSKIKSIENLLYGTSSTTVSTLPSPSELFDLMNFGDEIIITDNGDGTWTATGRSESISVFANGNFELRGVTAALLPDGSYIFGVDNNPVDYLDFDGGTPGVPGSSVYDGGNANPSDGAVYDGGVP